MELKCAPEHLTVVLFRICKKLGTVFSLRELFWLNYRTYWAILSDSLHDKRRNYNSTVLNTHTLPLQ